MTQIFHYIGSEDGLVRVSPEPTRIENIQNPRHHLHVLLSSIGSYQ